MLTNRDDLGPLDSLEALREADALRTRPVIIARHAKAKPRSHWAAAEDDRPLAGTGKRQALASSGLYAAWAPSRILSSPWLRCLQTVTPTLWSTAWRLRRRSLFQRLALSATRRVRPAL